MSGKHRLTVGNNVIIGTRAKVLGPISVGNHARIGSNAIGVDSMPADTTGVGMPAGPVDHEATLRLAAFEPYKMPSSDCPDRVGGDLQALRAELADVEARLRRLTPAPERDATQAEYAGGQPAAE